MQRWRDRMLEKSQNFFYDLERLVNQDSGTEYKAGVDQISDWIEGRLKTLGAQVERIPQETAGDQVIARLRGDGTLRGNSRQRYLLLAHSDTVFPTGTAAERPFRSEGNRSYGPGVIDMKSGLLVALYAMELLGSEGRDLFGELIFCCSTDEEAGSPTSRPVIEQAAAGVDAAFVLEPARQDGSIVSARKGAGVLHLEVRGRSAHAGIEPDKGRNAIVELAHQILQISALHGWEAGVTVNVGVVAGGSKSNVVPDHAAAQIDFRVPDPASADRLLARIHELLAQRRVADVEIECQTASFVPPMPFSEGTAELLRHARHAAADLGLTLKDTHTGGGSDGNWVAGLGIPVLDGLGPVGGLQHTPGEYLENRTVPERTALLCGIIESLKLGSPPASR